MDRLNSVTFFQFTNEILSTAIVIITASMLLYNITRHVRDRVTRASSILLGCVTISYIGDVFIALEPSKPQALENWFRFQWIGLAIIPAAMFHLSDALLATTGRISRGRRRRASRLLYVVGAVFALASLFTDTIVKSLVEKPTWHMKPGSLFLIYTAYFLVAVSFAVFNVVRARRRCLTTHTRRRMTYLLAAFTTPAWGLYPYSLLLSIFFDDVGTLSNAWIWLVFNIANVAVLAMLAFMAYPLSFFGTHQPDRVVKAELLEFMLRGPVTGTVVLAAIQIFAEATSVLGIEGQQFISFAAVTVVLCMQWMFTLIMPRLEGWLVYTHDQEQARRLQTISERLLTRADAAQLHEAILAAVCDQLRVPTAFVASIGEWGAHLEQVVGRIPEEDRAATEEILTNGFSNGNDHNPLPDGLKRSGRYFSWRSFWLVPLYSKEGKENTLMGIMGIWGRTAEPNLNAEEEDTLNALVQRSIQVLMDERLQRRIFSTLGELIPVSSTTLQRTNVSTFGQVSIKPEKVEVEQNKLTDSPEFIDLVRDALRDYWGGPKLAESKLLELGIVDHVAKTDGNRVHALRRVLVDAIERLRPEGQQNLTKAEWILYNILEMRFIQGRRVRDVALRLAMSNADFYRKQRVAIEEVARIIAETEQRLLETNQAQSQADSNDSTLVPADA
ncbi:MAG: hypothetical protein HND46_18960 [Chloroflexi bacterium]|nr:hypothetical protein [Chloroflexota bacterium]NOG65504.1 hypothetical protein [Chloroflexota bacterium]